MRAGPAVEWRFALAWASGVPQSTVQRSTPDDEWNRMRLRRTIRGMAFPIKICVACEEEFELKPGKPGFANRCPECSLPEAETAGGKQKMDADERKSAAEANEARRQAMKNLLYRKES